MPDFQSHKLQLHPTLNVSPTYDSDKGNNDTMVLEKHNNFVDAVQGSIPEILTGDRIYYVRADGSDTNNGLSDAPGGAFLTPQKGIDTLSQILGGGYSGKVKIGSGTYTSPIVLKSCVGYQSITIEGDVDAPSNVLISTTNNDCIKANGVNTKYILKGLKLTTTTTGFSLVVLNKSVIDFGKIDFGTVASGYSHIVLDGDPVVRAIDNYSISGGGGGRHIALYSPCTFSAEGKTITLTGSPNFDIFALVDRMSYCNLAAMTFSGSATGKRFQVSKNSVLYVGTSDTNYLPGNTGGTTETGGIYAN